MSDHTMNLRATLMSSFDWWTIHCIIIYKYIHVQKLYYIVSHCIISYFEEDIYNLSGQHSWKMLLSFITILVYFRILVDLWEIGCIIPFGSKNLMKTMWKHEEWYQYTGLLMSYFHGETALWQCHGHGISFVCTNCVAINTPSLWNCRCTLPFSCNSPINSTMKHEFDHSNHPALFHYGIPQKVQEIKPLGWTTKTSHLWPP